jgi:short-subunit dehydrogenase
MINPLERLATTWIGRWARPHPDALAATRDLTPAVVITGGSSGIGFALAAEFARRGDALVLVGRTQSRLEAAVNALQQSHAGVRVDTLLLDVGRPESTSVLSSWLEAHGLYCDVLVNNAAVGISGPYSVADPVQLETLVATNVAAVVRFTRAVLPSMLARGHGGIITVSSLGALIPGPNQAAYYASKAFVLSLSEAIASETSGLGVRVTAVLPGPVETRFHARMKAEGSLYRHVLAAATPERVARLTMRGYRLGRRVVAPGLVPTLAIVALRYLPHALTVPMVRWLLDTGHPAPPPTSDDLSPRF